MMSLRLIVKFLTLSVAVFLVAFAIRWAFFWDIKPVSWDYEPPQNGALEAAFFLLSVENIAAVVAAIAVVSAVILGFRRLRRGIAAAGRPSPLDSD
jgi:hypothetical protein